MHSKNSDKKIIRKKHQNEANWKFNVRKRKHDRGEECISVYNTIIPGKQVKILKDCQDKCIYQCALNITEASNICRILYANL